MKKTYMYSTEQAKKLFLLIDDKSITDLDLKLYCILTLVWDEWMGLTPALQLCEALGIFKSSYMEISMRLDKKLRNKVTIECENCGVEFEEEEGSTSTWCDECHNTFIESRQREEAEGYARWEKEEERRAEIRKEIYGDD